MLALQIQVQMMLATMKSWFTKEDGAVDIVAVVILVAVAVALAIVFKDTITGVVQDLLSNVQASSDQFKS